MSDQYKLRVYRLSLSSFSSLVPWASHWWCRLYWTDESGERQQADAQCRDEEYPTELTGRFRSRAKARAAGLRLARKLSEGGYYVVIECNDHSIDPGPCLSAPGNLRKRLNALWRRFEKLDGWEAPKELEPEVQKICDRWSTLIGETQWVKRA